MINQNSPYTRSLYFFTLVGLLSLGACNSGDGGSSATDMCANLGKTTQCMAIYAVPERSSVMRNVDHCWGGPHITMSGFYAYEAGDPRLPNLKDTLDTAAVYPAPSGENWSVPKNSSYWAERIKHGAHDQYLQLNEPPSNDDRDFYLTFPNYTKPNTQDQQDLVTGEAKQSYETLNQVTQQLQSFPVNEPHCDPSLPTGQDDPSQPSCTALPLHITFKRTCNKSTPCFENAAQNLWGGSTMGESGDTWNLVPVLLPLKDGGCAPNLGSTCHDSTIQYCRDRKSVAIMRAPLN